MLLYGTEEQQTGDDETGSSSSGEMLTLFCHIKQTGIPLSIGTDFQHTYINTFSLWKKNGKESMHVAANVMSNTLMNTGMLP